MSAAVENAPHGFFAACVRELRRGVTGWSIGLAAVALMYGAFYPSIRESAAELSAYVERMPQAFKELVGEDYTSPAGYLRGELFSSMGVILMLIFAIGAGARAIAGEEERRTLDLLLSTPLRRTVVLRDKALAAGAGVLTLAAVLLVVVAVAGPVFDLTIATGRLVSACLMLALLALAFGSIALAVGTATGHRAIGAAVSAAIAVVSVIVNALAPSVDILRPIRPLSLFRWYQNPDPLTGGLHLPNVMVLVVVAIVGYVIAHVTFQRRDLAS